MTNPSIPKPYRSGMVAIVGRPNVGKSTLMNRLIGVKLSIVSRRAQTTRHRILGIYTDSRAQIAFLDTPGFQLQHSSALNREMNRTVTSALREVDAVMLVVEAGRLTKQDEEIVSMLPDAVPAVAVINKTDKLKDRALLLPFIEKLRTAHRFTEFVPVSAANGDGIAGLIDIVIEHLPVGAPVYEEDAITDRPERFLAAEIVREKLFQFLGEELPYGTTVEIERFEHQGQLRRINATVIVSKPAHKAMVIGARGAKLKIIGTRARKDMEQLFGGKVFLEVWVRVKQGWADDARSLRSLGYG
ncbi:MAG: GTPase Era [Betaproteobacteria bacterium SG8_40]|jgi:GTP-binding protein Era|nr:MAG: GTPase Era [Betaproteobacteria bacterium SG8_40]